MSDPQQSDAPNLRADAARDPAGELDEFAVMAMEGLDPADLLPPVEEVPLEAQPPSPAVPDAPVDPHAAFWTASAGVSVLNDPTPHGSENALQKLGRPPFERSIRTKFRLLGYLATVYEHVSSDHRAPAPAPMQEQPS